MSKWIAHTKKFARDNGITYGEALADPENKRSYYATKKECECCGVSITKCAKSPKRCPKGKRRSPKTGKCVAKRKSPAKSPKRCPKGKRKSPKTGKCVAKRKSPKRKSPKRY